MLQFGFCLSSLRTFTLLIFSFCALSAQALNLASVKGFGVDTTAGSGGEVIKVTTLAADGPGSLRAALAHSGKRVVVFEVGGVINLAGANIDIVEPFLTLAGETAPAPGITLIRGGLSVRTHDVRISHIAVRPGTNGKPALSGWEPDGIGVSRAQARNVHIDHVSTSWAVDENMSASGERYEGPGATSGRVTFSNSIIAEALDYSTHKKGKHSKGILIHDYVQEIAVVGNLFAHNDRRNPYFKAHATGVVVNNLMYNLGNAAVQLGYIAHEWDGHKRKPGNPKVAVVGNKLIYGRDTYSDLALVSYQGDVYLQSNQVLNLNGGDMAQVQGDINLLDKAPVWPQGLQPIQLNNVYEHVLNNAGSRPWERDLVDQRIIDSVRNKTGRIIDSQDAVGGYPDYKPTYRALDVPSQSEDVAEWLLSFVPTEYR
ncbi:right-handed parallel beta-helix repeat-containing protein [Gilvimarinus japonicus]|uniref:Right-handed parallel beta-helix repeat-containing protein n=1 Tax=Gilvimarinus japonicus TaxID=1796469 RepID=A0ABV7HQS1_9GAMM